MPVLKAYHQVRAYFKDPHYKCSSSESISHDVHECGVKCLRFDIRGANSKHFTVILNVSQESLYQDLFAEVEKLTSIPQKLQLLTFRQCILDSKHLMHEYKFSSENIIDLSVKGVGGGPSDDGI